MALAYRAVQTAAPAVEPVTQNEAKNHLRVDTSADDNLIDGLIAAARQWVEHYTRRALITQTWEASLDRFPVSESEPIVLPKTPLLSVGSISYLDLQGSTQTWAASNYQVDSVSEPARILPVEAADYPSEQDDTLNTVTITFDAGYGDAETDVPSAIRQAMLLLIGEMYERREQGSPQEINQVPFGVQALLGPYRVLTP
jgi:uncharacterized phiE125 gp8 family phage protein